MFWLHEWSWWDSILPMNATKQGVVGHCYGLNPRRHVKLPKYMIWQGLNSPSIKTRTSWKKSWMLYEIPHSAAQGLFATAVQFRWKKKKYSPTLTSPIVILPKCCFRFVPWAISESELALYFQFTCDTVHEGRPWIPYTILPSFMSSSPTPNTFLNHYFFGSNNKAKQVKF